LPVFVNDAILDNPTEAYNDGLLKEERTVPSEECLLRYYCRSALFSAV